MAKELSFSRDLFPSVPRSEELLARESDDYVPPQIDIQEPLSIRPGETKTVSFRYRSGVPQGTAFGITWHATELDADAGINILQDMLLPSFEIFPPSPRRDTGEMQAGTVRLSADRRIPIEILYGSMAIYQP